MPQVHTNVAKKIIINHKLLANKCTSKDLLFTYNAKLALISKKYL